jgi:hypothetical protein
MVGRDRGMVATMYDKRYEIYQEELGGYRLMGSTDDLRQAVQSAKELGQSGRVFDTRLQKYPYSADWDHSESWEKS